MFVLKEGSFFGVRNYLDGHRHHNSAVPCVRYLMIRFCFARLVARENGNRVLPPNKRL